MEQQNLIFLDLFKLNNDISLNEVNEQQDIKKRGRPKIIFTIEDKQKHKKISNDRPEEKKRRLEYNKKYYNEHSNIINCECSGRYIAHNLKYHLSTKKHQKYINELNNKQ